MGRVIMMPDVWLKIWALEETLYKQGYFGFKESAKAYIDEIIDFAQTIPKQRHHATKQSKYGQYYCRYSPNRKTTYYITFDKREDVYLIRNVFNNHSIDYAELIKGPKQ